MAKKERKSRYWGFIIYPNDVDKLWLDKLINTKLKLCISPLHDSDQWTELDIQNKKKYCEEKGIKVGDTKKEHYHCMIAYPNTTTENSILCILGLLDLDINHIEPINSVIGQYEYFFHKNNDDKHQYDEADIKCFNGFNIHDYYELSSIETLQLKMWVTHFANEKHIYHYYDLVNKLIELDCIDELSIVINNTQFFNTYLKSKKDKSIANEYENNKTK